MLENIKSALPSNFKNLKVGLLGGSFNPAHDGHVHVSNKAIELLGLDIVIWLVSPQNPLKVTDISKSLDKRVLYAKEFTDDYNQSSQKIFISDLERYLPTNYTRDAVHFLKITYPQNNFIWLMGAENMAQIHKWHNWRDIFEMVPIAVFDREDYAQKAIYSEAAKIYENSLITKKRIDNINNYSWCFFCIEKYDMSSTKIRNLKGWEDRYERIDN